MAYDKVVDSSVLDAGLKQIADAIREKGGTSDSLAFPDAMAAAIAAIQAGGGATLWEGGSFIYGSFVLTEEMTSAYTIVTKDDDRYKNLLAEAGTHYAIGLVVAKRPTESSNNVKGSLVFGARVPAHYGNGSARYDSGKYISSSGSISNVSSSAVAISADSLEVYFTTKAKGVTDYEYQWIAWRTVKR